MKTTSLQVSYSIVVNNKIETSTIIYQHFPVGISISRALFNQIEKTTRASAKAFHACDESELHSFKILGIIPIEEG